jgi:hypothetical protein
MKGGIYSTEVSPNHYWRKTHTYEFMRSAAEMGPVAAISSLIKNKDRFRHSEVNRGEECRLLEYVALSAL